MAPFADADAAMPQMRISCWDGTGVVVAAARSPFLAKFAHIAMSPIQALDSRVLKNAFERVAGQN